ncbi:MAG: hypothetical protein ACO3QI_03815 [Ilumatobacteraceae bacterium]
MRWFTSQSRRSAVQSGRSQKYLARRFAADRANRQMWLRWYARAQALPHHVRRLATSMRMLHH